MFSSLKNIARLAIATFIVVLIVFIIVNVGNKNKTQTKPVQNSPTINRVINNNNDNSDNDLENDNDDELENLETVVDAPDTGSKETINIVIGLIILSSGVLYIYRYNN